MNYKKKYFIGIGAAVVILVSGSFFLRNVGQSGANCVEYTGAKCNVAAVQPQASSKANSGDLGEFEQMDAAAQPSQSQGASDEFSSLNATEAASASVVPSSAKVSLTDSDVLDPAVAFVVLALIGLGLRHAQLVRFRGLFLLAGVAWFGFYRGGCECMIGSFQHLVLGLMSGSTQGWTLWLWLASLVVATYLFGRVWCGWLCHLGGVQDFLFRGSKFSLLSSATSQRVLRVVRYVVLTAWIIQLLWMRKNVFCEYDPFKSLFNLLFTDWVSVALLLLLLVSSVLIYRPFCRMICPVGVVLGWVSHLPGARKMHITSSCVGCGSCAKVCAMHAIEGTKERRTINSDSCIACGECKTACHKGGIKNEVK